MDEQFRVIIAAVDQVTEPMRTMAASVEAMNRRIESSVSNIAAPFAQVGASVDLLHNQISRLGRNLGFERIAHAANNLGGRLNTMRGHVLALAGPLAGLGALATAGGIFGALRHATETGSALNDLWTRFGANTPARRRALADLRYSARQSGATAEDVTTGLTRLNRGLAQAAGGQDADLASLFRRLGIATRDARGQIRSAVDVLPELARAFDQNENAAVRTRIAMALFGKQGASLIPAMIEFRENAERRARFGSVFTPEQVQQLDEFDDASADAEMAVTGLSDAISASLAPVLTPLLTSLAMWVSKNRELIASKVANFVSDVGDAVKNLDWSGTWQGIRDTAKAINDSVEIIGGWKVALAGVGLAMAGPLLAAIVGVTTAVGALGVAMLTTPLGLAVTAFGAVGYAAYHAYGAIHENWGAIGEWFERQIAPIRDALKSLGEWWDSLTSRIGGRANAPAAPRANRNSPGGARRIEGFDTPEPANDAGRDSLLRLANQRGEVQVRVTFDGLPPSARAEATSTGPALAAPQLAVGYAMGGAR